MKTDPVAARLLLAARPRCNRNPRCRDAKAPYAGAALDRMNAPVGDPRVFVPAVIRSLPGME